MTPDQGSATEAPRKPTECQLVNAENDKPVAPDAVENYWQDGEWDVTGSLPKSTRRSKGNAFLAYDDALDKALEHFSAKYACIGSCGDERLCNLAVRVLNTRSPRLVRRRVPTDPESFQFRRLGIREVERVYLQLSLQVTCGCECIERPPVTSGGSGVQSATSSSGGGVLSFDD